MAGKSIIAICQSGGEFKTEKNGAMTYVGGDAHAFDIDDHMKFSEFKAEITELFGYGLNCFSIKYFLPGNKKTLISISNDKDLQRMIKFHGDCPSADVYIMVEEMALPELSNMHASRSSRTTLSETVIPIGAPLEVVDDMNVDPFAGLGIVNETETMDVQFNMASETIPDIPLLSSTDEKHMKVAEQWQYNITGVGQRFTSVTEFRESLRKYAIAHQFSFKYKKNDSHRVTVKCKEEGCPWRIHASRLSTTQLICIKKMHPSHTCEGAAVASGYQATRNWVASIIKEKLKVNPDYKPKDIVNDVKEEYGIQLNYFQAWRGKEVAREQLQGSYKEAYGQLPVFCEKIMESNPGSLATFTTKDDSSFHRLFVSFHASLYGFQQGCRPLLFLDSVSLKTKYQGMLLAATAADANENVFPVAFAVVDSETEDNWRWFLLQLKSALLTSTSLTFVADRRRGLKESIADIFENSSHGFCLKYLAEELITSMKDQFSHEVKRMLIEDFYEAAYASKLETFHQCVARMKSISPEAYDWVVKSDPVNWANMFFTGTRYNHVRSDFGEILYGWASDAHELPITQMVETIRCKMMVLIYDRRLEAEQWLTRLTPSMEQKLEKETRKARSLQVLLSEGSSFEVCGGTPEVVNIDRLDCSCRGWQLTGLPCSHAIAVISCLGQSPYDYCSRYLTTESYRLTYSESIHPLPSIELPSQNESSQMPVRVTPPPTRRPPGRPTKKRCSSHQVMKRKLVCSRCKGAGHNKSSCKEISAPPKELEL